MMLSTFSSEDSRWVTKIIVMSGKSTFMSLKIFCSSEDVKDSLFHQEIDILVLNRARGQKLSVASGHQRALCLPLQVWNGNHPVKPCYMVMQVYFFDKNNPVKIDISVGTPNAMFATVSFNINEDWGT